MAFALAACHDIFVTLMSNRRSFLLAFASLGIPWAQAQEPSAAMLDAVAKARADLRTLRGAFTQKRTIGLLASEVVSRGLVELKTPDRLRWELLAPDAMTYWVTPGGLAFAGGDSSGYVPRGSGGPMSAVLDDLLVVLGGDLRALTPRYDLSIRRLADHTMQLDATPRVASRTFQKLTMVLEPNLVSPRRIVMKETDDDRIEIVFKDVVTNAPIDEARLRPPRAGR